MRKSGACAVAIAALLISGPMARADVKTGVDAWAQGDFAKAVAEWRPLAEGGDADAQFNLGQAYKLGRGVPMNLVEALEWYWRAAAQGHARAEDNYGLLLFQQNQRQEAMPFLQRSAIRGEPRAQYLVGTAHFNGDLLPRDWTRAYALISRAASAGLPQATTALAQMDQYVSAGQRQQGLALAAELAEKESAPAADATPSASLAKAATVIHPKSAANGTTAKPGTPIGAVKPTATPPVASAAGGQWRIQLGAFAEPARAQSQWKALSDKVSGLSGLEHYLVPAGAMTRLQAGPFKSRSDADKLCASVKANGAECIVKPL